MECARTMLKLRGEPPATNPYAPALRRTVAFLARNPVEEPLQSFERENAFGPVARHRV